METDLEQIGRLAVAKDDENWMFRSYLKASNYSSQEIDAIIRKLYQQVVSEIDCKTCANCCRTITPQPDQTDIERLSTVLGIATAQFEEQYLDASSGKFKKPCPLLRVNLCSVYEHRPRECVGYPYLQNEGFTSRLMRVLDNYAICPIVFNVYEHLKAIYWGKKKHFVSRD
jgi:hypothetical protein